MFKLTDQPVVIRFILIILFLIDAVYFILFIIQIRH